MRELALRQPHGLRVDAHGNIWSIDSYQNVIYKQDSNGSVVKVFGTRGHFVRSDDSVPNDKGLFRYSKEKLKVVQKKGEKPIERSLWCETSFELGK